MNDFNELRTHCIDKTWGAIGKNPEYREILLTDAAVLDTETFKPAETSGNYTIDLNLGLCVPGYYNADTGEITIDDDAVIFDPWE